jgi:biopolymer transport protein ExbD
VENSWTPSNTSYSNPAMFLLLVFFIYAMLSMAVHRGLQLGLPESSVASESRVSRL